MTKKELLAQIQELEEKNFRLTKQIELGAGDPIKLRTFLYENIKEEFKCRATLEGYLLMYFGVAIDTLYESDGGPNFLTMEIRTSRYANNEVYEVTIRKPNGKSTSAVLGELRDENKKLRDRLAELGFPTCRVCGCTDDDCSQCIEAQGKPCHWVEADLCSRCESERPSKTPKEAFERLEAHLAAREEK